MYFALVAFFFCARDGGEVWRLALYYFCLRQRKVFVVSCLLMLLAFAIKVLWCLAPPLGLSPLGAEVFPPSTREAALFFPWCAAGVPTENTFLDCAPRIGRMIFGTFNSASLPFPSLPFGSSSMRIRWKRECVPLSVFSYFFLGL